MDRKKNGKESIGCKKTRSFRGLYRGQWSARDRWLLSKTNGRGISKEFSLQRTTLLEKFSSVRFWSTTTSSGWSAKRTRARRFRSKLHFPLHFLAGRSYDRVTFSSCSFHRWLFLSNWCKLFSLRIFFFFPFLLEELVVVLYIIITFVSTFHLSWLWIILLILFWYFFED